MPPEISRFLLPLYISTASRSSSDTISPFSSVARPKVSRKAFLSDSASSKKFPERLFSPSRRPPESFPTLPPEISRFLLPLDSLRPRGLRQTPYLHFHLSSLIFHRTRARKSSERLFSPIQRPPESFPTTPPEISRFLLPLDSLRPRGLHQAPYLHFHLSSFIGRPPESLLKGFSLRVSILPKDSRLCLLKSRDSCCLSISQLPRCLHQAPFLHFHLSSFIGRPPESFPKGFSLRVSILPKDSRLCLLKSRDSCCLSISLRPRGLRQAPYLHFHLSSDARPKVSREAFLSDSASSRKFPDYST